MPKMAVYVAHYIYLTPFAYLQATTHCRTLLHLSVFPDEIVAADLRQICLILDPAHLFAFAVTCGPAYVVQVAALLKTVNCLDGTLKQSVKTSEH